MYIRNDLVRCGGVGIIGNGNDNFRVHNRGSLHDFFIFLIGNWLVLNVLLKFR